MESNDHHSQVELLGWCGNVEQLLYQSDIYVHLSKWEGLSLAVLEAMQAGLPVIISSSMEIPIGFEPKVSGFIVGADDTCGLTDALLFMAERTESEVSRTARLNWRIVQKNYVDSISCSRLRKIIKELSND